MISKKINTETVFCCPENKSWISRYFIQLVTLTLDLNPVIPPFWTPEQKVKIILVYILNSKISSG